MFLPSNITPYVLGIQLCSISELYLYRPQPIIYAFIKTSVSAWYWGWTTWVAFLLNVIMVSMQNSLRRCILMPLNPKQLVEIFFAKFLNFTKIHIGCTAKGSWSRNLIGWGADLMFSMASMHFSTPKMETALQQMFTMMLLLVKS